MSIDEVGWRIGRPTADPKATNVWIADLESDSHLPLSDQLTEVERFLADKIEVLEELTPACEISLFMSWTPKAGQDHALFSPTLIKLLGRIGVDVSLDTWTGCEFCKPDNEPTIVVE